MSSWYDTYPAVSSNIPQAAGALDKLYGDVVAEKEEIPPMPKFDKERTLKTMMEGSEEQKRALVEELANMLDYKPYGLVWERGGTREDSPFEAENVVLEYDKGIPYPVIREDLSLSTRERERERAA